MTSQVLNISEDQIEEMRKLKDKVKLKKSDGIARNVTIIDETTKAMDDVDINASMRLTKSSMGAHGRQQSRERSSSIKRERTNKNRS